MLLQETAGPLPPPRSLTGPATSREGGSSEPPACLACSLSHSAASVRQRPPPSQAEPCGAGQSQHTSSLAGVSAGVSFSSSGSLGFAAPSSPSSSSSLGGFVHLGSGGDQLECP